MTQKTTTNGTPPGRLLTTHEAQITTVAIEIKALRIGPKQMTQSVFRQLPVADVIDPKTGLVQGTPWGKVNYFWGECQPDHLHIVWEDQHWLYRSCVWPHWARDHVPFVLDGLRGQALVQLRQTFQASYGALYFLDQLYIAV